MKDKRDREIPVQEVLAVGGSVSAAGNNTIIAAVAARRIRVHYFSYNPEAANRCYWAFGAAGTPMLQNRVPANSVIAKQFDPWNFLVGAVNLPLLLNLESGTVVNYTVFYEVIEHG